MLLDAAAPQSPPTPHTERSFTTLAWAGVNGGCGSRIRFQLT
jgi:hypothetical protein